MANKTLSGVKILLRNDTAANWTAKNPILSKGELGIEIDTKKFKFGDGAKAWDGLAYASADAVDPGTLHINISNVTGAGSAATKTAGNDAGNVPVLDDKGKLSDAVIPALAISDTFEAVSETAMLALNTAQKGDVCIRSDLSKTFILKGESAGTIENWVELKSPTDVVTSVNGKTGAVALTAADISGTENFVSTADIIILDGGNA